MTARDPFDTFGFDGVGVELPTATLRPGRSQARHQRIRTQLVQWVAHRWTWLRPRSVPMLVALTGMFAVLGATDYLTDLARGSQRRAAAIDTRPWCSVITVEPAQDLGRPPSQIATLLAASRSMNGSMTGPDHHLVITLCR